MNNQKLKFRPIPLLLLYHMPDPILWHIIWIYMSLIFHTSKRTPVPYLEKKIMIRNNLEIHKVTKGYKKNNVMYPGIPCHKRSILKQYCYFLVRGLLFTMKLLIQGFTVVEFKSSLWKCMVTIIPWWTVTEGCATNDLNGLWCLVSQSRLLFLLSWSLVIRF